MRYAEGDGLGEGEGVGEPLFVELFVVEDFLSAVLVDFFELPLPEVSDVLFCVAVFCVLLELVVEPVFVEQETTNAAPTRATNTDRRDFFIGL